MAQAARLTLRLQKELKLLLTDPPPGVSFPFLSSDSDVFSLSTIDAQIEGPEGTVYSEGKFRIKIQIPERYPFQPPNVTFATPIYHPNIDNGGRICLDILNLPPKGAWQPSLNISTVMTSIGLLLSEPNPDDGLMCEMSREYKYNRCVFDQKARAMTEKYAKAGVCGNSSSNQNVQTNADISTSVDGRQSNEESKHEVSTNDEKPSGISRKLSLAPSRSTHKEDDDRHSNVQLDFTNNEAKIESRMLSLNHYQQHNFQHLLDASSNSKCKETLTVRKKLSLGSIGLPEGTRKDEKENILPIKLPQSNPENRMKTEIVQKQPTNETQNQKHNRDQTGILTERTQQPREEIPVPESVIVLDSEDSEEEQDVAMRSKLSLVRKRIGKRKTQA